MHTYSFIYLNWKVIKLQAWEGEYEKRIMEIRERELALFKK
jgi:hypothetical protein